MAKKRKSDPNAGGALQLGFFTPDSDWRPVSLGDLPSWKNAKRVCIDAETKDPSIGNNLGSGSMRDGQTVGWAFAIEGGPKHYLPIRHEGGDNVDCEQALGYLREQIKNFSGEFVGANLAYDMDYGYNDGFEYHPEAKFRDVLIADPLIYELHPSYSLLEVGKRLGIESKKEELLFNAARAYGLDPKKGLWRLPARYVGEYAERDVASPLEILRKQEEIIERDNLRKVWDLETDVLPVLVRMRRRGLRIDLDKLDQVERWTIEEEELALSFIKQETNVSIGFGDVWKPNAVAPALEAIGIKLGTTTAGNPQVDRFLLKGNSHPVCKKLLRARKLNKLRTTFVKGVRKHMVGDRLHCQFNQISREDEGGNQKGVRYGRLSATHPSVQNQPNPKRDPEIAKEWRKVYIAEEGCVWGKNDYSQQEPRFVVHFAATMDFPKAREVAQRYRDDPDMDSHDMMTRLIHTDQMVDEWDGNETYQTNRTHSKDIFLGRSYTEGGPSICNTLGLPTRWGVSYGYGANRVVEFFEKRHDAMKRKMELGKGYLREMAGEEGQRILDQFDEKVPYVIAIQKAATNRAKSRGCIKTIYGRRLNFERLPDGTFDFTHKALNRLIQGSSGDQAKQAMVDIDRAGYFINLQVHDEINGSYASRKEAQLVGDLMRDAYQSEWLPFKVDTEIGPNWGEVA